MSRDSRESPALLEAKRLYAELGRGYGGPWVVSRTEYPGPMLLAIIEAAGNHVYQFDYAGAEVRREMLVRIGALSAVRGPDGTITYARARVFPEVKSTNPVDAENARLLANHKAERDRLNREIKAAEDAKRTLDAPLIAAERHKFAEHMAALGLDPQKLEARLAALEAAIQRLECHLGVQDDMSPNGGDNSDSDGQEARAEVVT